MQVMMKSSTAGLSRPLNGVSRRHLQACSSTSTLLVRAAAQGRQQQQAAELADATSTSSSSSLLPLVLAGSALFSSTPFAAWADEETAAAAPAEAAEGVQQAAAALTEAAADAAPAPSWLSYIVVLAPIIFYAIFNVYRSQVNPRIKFSDFLFIVAGIAVVANLVSIIGFRVRLF